MKYSFKFTGDEIQRELFVDFVAFSVQDIRESYMYEQNLSEEEVKKISDEELFKKHGNDFSDIDKHQYYLTDGEINNLYPVDAHTPSVEDKEFELFVSNMLNPENPNDLIHDWSELYEFIMDNYLKESNDIKSLYEFTYKNFKIYNRDKDIINLFKEKHDDKELLNLFISNRNYNFTMYFICHHLNAFPIKVSKYSTKYLLQTA